MKCPHGDHNLDVPERAYQNAWQYHKPNVTITNCCGNAVRVSPVTTFEIDKVTGVDEDDWGYTIGKGDME